MRRASLIPLGLIFLLAGCNGVPLSTVWKLRGFKPTEQNVGQMRFAMRGPDWMRPTPETSRVELTHWRDDTPNDKHEFAVHLRRGEHKQDEADIKRAGGGEAPFTIYDAQPRDLEGARALIKEAREQEAKGEPKHRGNASLKGVVACHVGEIPSGDFSFSMYVHPSDELGWLPLYPDYQVRRASMSEKDEKAFHELVAPCEKHANRAEALRTD